ncbi:MAG: hypothetical protein ACKONH_00430, partial [Planctomycetia bacterium]
PQHRLAAGAVDVLAPGPARPHELPVDVRHRLLERERPRLTQDGAILITSQRHREQPRNVADCLAKLSAILERALVPPKARRRTRTPRSAIRERLEAKKHRSQKKRLRGGPVE